MKPQTQTQAELLSSSAQAGIHRLVHNATKARIGYSIRGADVGPRALAIGRSVDATVSFDRIAALESIVRIKGHLILAFEEPIFDITSGLTVDHLYCERFDGSIYLASAGTDFGNEVKETSIHREAYWSVLRLCKRLGMISGRGVPTSDRELAQDQ